MGAKKFVTGRKYFIIYLPLAERIEGVGREMSYDLNVPWSTNSAELKRTLAFLTECE